MRTRLGALSVIVALSSCLAFGQAITASLRGRVVDKTGAVVKDLKASDFQILEDNKPQRVASFDF